MNNTQNNNYGYAGYGTMGGFNPAGYTYQQNPQQPKYTQPLTKEQIAMLRQNVDKFSLSLTQEEVYRGICFHRDTEGNNTLRENPDGTVTCTICGHTFNPVQALSEDETQAVVNDLVDVLQTIKLLYLDMPADAAAEFFQVIPLLEKVPKLFKVASENFSRHEQWQNWRFNGAPNTINLYQMLAGGAPINVAPYQGQQMMGGMAPVAPTPMGAPLGSMPMNQGYMGQQIAPGSNGMGVMPGATYQPQSNGYQYNAPVAQQTPSTPAAPATTEQPADVKVDATFKA